ncbi:MAG: ROK family protein [Planctomycetaceae bacterium]|nr:ROK family protein [Planctomycetaceae bacterium]
MGKTATPDKNSQKHDNRKAVLDVFRKNLVMTVAEAADLCGLSKPTVHRAAEFLVGKGLLLPTGKGLSGDEGGKKPILYTFNAGYRHILTFQILATTLLSAVSDMRGKLRAENSVAFRPDTPLEEIMDHMRAAADAMTSALHLRHEDYAGFVVGCHGVTDPEKGTIAGSAYFPSWGVDIPFTEPMQALFAPSPPLFIDNSNRYDAIAEMRAGAARGRDSFLVIDGETDGLGAGMVLGGALWRGSQSLAGEIGHMVVDPTGARTCYCGGKGCLETMASMASLVEAARSGYGANRKSLLFARLLPGELSYRDIYDIANAGDPFARRVVEEQARWLAIGIANVTMVADPGLVILQGPYAHGGEWLLDRIRHFLAGFSLPRTRRRPDITLSTFGRERGLVGGAHVVAESYFANPALYQER